LSHKNIEKLPLLVGLDNFAIRPGGLGRAFNYICQEFENDRRQFHRIEIGLERNGKNVLPNSSLLKRARWLLLQGYDLRHSTTYIFSHFAMHAFILSFFIKAPLFTFFHGPWVDESLISKNKSSISSLIKFFIEKIIYKRSKKIFCASISFKEILIERFKIPEEKIQIIPLGVDLERFTIVPKADARKSLQLIESSSIFISVRRLTNRMGQKDLINAFAYVLKKNPNSYLYLIGNGPNKLDYEEQIEALGINENVKILTEVSDDQLPLWYSAANASIVPSKYLEGFGLVVLESLACGTPVIATKCDGLTELITKWNPQFLVNIESPNELADKICDFLSGNLKTAINENQAFASEYTWNKCFHTIIHGLGEISITFLSSEGVISGAELSLLELVSILRIDNNCNVILGNNGDLYAKMEKLQIVVKTDSNLVLEFNRKSSFLQFLKAIIMWPKQCYLVHNNLQFNLSDYIFINTFKTLLITSFHILISRRKTIFWAHDSFINNGKYDKFKNLFYKLLLRQSNIITVCNSKFTSDTLWNSLKIKSKFILYPYVKPPSDLVRRESSSPYLIGISGRISPWKGQLFALKSLKSLFTDFPDLKLELLGSPLFNDFSYYNDIKHYIDCNSLSERVILIPFADNPFNVISKWGVSIHSSTEPEPFGRTIVDSLLASVPVIVPDAGGPLEIVKDLDCCLIYEMGNATDLRTKVKLFLSDVDTREKLYSGTSIVFSNLGMESQIANFKKLLNDEKLWQR